MGVEVIGIVGLTLAVALGGAAITVASRRALGRAWLEAARAAGLQDVSLRSRAGWLLRVTGRRGPLCVRIDSFYNQAGGFGRTHPLTGTRIEISGLAPDIALRPQPVPGLVGLSRSVRGVEAGDPAFDDAVLVNGPPALVRALLDAPTRRLTRDLFAPRAIFLGGDVSLETAIRLQDGRLVAKRMRGARADWIASGLSELVRLAEALVPPAELPPRLLANVRGDPDASVRLCNLRTLVREFPDLPITREAQGAALCDEDDGVRLEAAIGLGAEGRPTLLRIAASDRSADTHAARAIDELGAEWPAPQARLALTHALRARRLRTAEACLESLSRRGPEEAGLIGGVLAREEGRLAAAAARALGRVGKADAVSVLREAEARLSRDAALRRAARDAVAAIQARLVGAEPGQVSLPGPEAGHLSLASDDEGRLTLPGGDAGERTDEREPGSGRRTAPGAS